MTATETLKQRAQKARAAIIGHHYIDRVVTLHPELDNRSGRMKVSNVANGKQASIEITLALEKIAAADKRLIRGK